MPDVLPPDTPLRTDRLQFLNREAAEVYLLLDFLSGRSDRSIAASPDELGRALLCEQATKTTVVDDSTAAEIADRVRVEADLKDPTRLILRVMAIKYPLVPDSSQFEADAAFLLRVRDVLNSRAAPATGAMIAFTWMVLRERLRRRRTGGAWLWFLNLVGGGRAVEMADEIRADAAAVFAKVAFPNFLGATQDLVKQIRGITLSTLLLLLIVVALSAYAAWGKVLLDTIDATRKDFGAIEQSIESLESTGTISAPTENVTGPTNAQIVHLCDRPRLLTPLAANSGNLEILVSRFDSTAEYHLCDRLSDVNKRISLAYGHLANWANFFLPWRDATTDEQWATAALTVLTNSVMPVLYGLLGSMAYVLRRFHDRMAGSLLTPRDQRANRIRLALGALIGACIGLFFNSSTATSQAAGVLQLAVNLSASALAFLAGYGVEGVLRTLDALISSLFKITDGTGSGGTAKP